MAESAYILSFHELAYTVTLRNGQPLTVLQPTNGSFVSGRLNALMGPSGAGKTSLLDILARMPVVGKAQGTVLLNGSSASAAGLSQLSCYVHQHEVLLPSATVREALITSAMLKLRSMSRQQKEERVETLLKQLELVRVADSLIGDDTFGIKGISGGEKRRVGVGVELVKDPPIIFLDEPTTGLDSEMALGVMRVLKSLAAHEGKMVVCTIHQPSDDITDLFDQFVLLARGRLLYDGPWRSAVPYFEEQGFSAPLHKSAANFFMSLASNPEILEQLANHHGTQQRKSLQLVDAPGMADVESGIVTHPDPIIVRTTTNESTAAPDSAGSGAAKGQSELDGAAGKGNRMQLVGGSGSGAPVWLQVWVLLVRFLRSWMRTPFMIIMEAAQYIILGVFIGLLYLRMSNELPDAPLDRFSSVFLSLALLSFTPSYTALVVWDLERKLLLREASSGMYRRGSFFIAKTFSTLPVEVIQVVLFSTIIYWMFGYQADAGKYFIFVTLMVLFALASETIGYICAIVTKDSKNGVALITVLMVVLMSFSGYLVRNVPIFFRWISKISYFNYAMDALVMNEFDGLYFTSPDGTQLVAATTFVPSAMATGLSVGGNLAVLAGMTVGMRFLAWGLLEMAALLKWL